MKKEIDSQIRELLDYMGKSWGGYKKSIEAENLEVASAYLAGFCTHVESLDKVLDIKMKAKEFGLNPGKPKSGRGGMAWMLIPAAIGIGILAKIISKR